MLLSYINHYSTFPENDGVCYLHQTKNMNM